jgi:hypothetical protein
MFTADSMASAGLDTNGVMKTCLIPIQIAVLSAVFSARSQGTFVYDQQSADETSGGGSLAIIQSNEPVGQSFTPGLSSVGFVRLYMADANPSNALGATVYVNLLANSITGPVIGSTVPVFMPNNFGWGTNGYVNFYFSTPVAVTPGVTYYFNPVVQSGDSWYVIGYNYAYSGGIGFLNGAAVPNYDLWFREGVVVPEPSSALLISIGAGAFVYIRRRHTGKRRDGVAH